jgi:hypothetical protein
MGPASGRSATAAPVMRRRLAAGALIGLPGLAPPAEAAHPLLTEDPGTQGQGRFELELGAQRDRENGATAVELGPQLSLGVLDDVDLIVRPTWLDVRGSAADARGMGDTALDFKWRFLEEGPFAFGLRAGVDVPTGSTEKGLGTGKASPHAMLIAAWNAEPCSVYANVEYVHDPLIGDRPNLWGGSVAVLLAVADRWRFSAEAGVASNPVPSGAATLAVARFGAILSVTPWLDVDVGYQAPLNRAAPDQVVLVGATLRW